MLLSLQIIYIYSKTNEIIIKTIKIGQMSIDKIYIKQENDDKDDFFRDAPKQKSVLKLTPYIDEVGLKNIHEFKYAGGDTGYGYIYFWSPLAIWCVNRTPEFLAPNLITFVGFLFVLVPFVYTFTVYGT